MVAVLRVPSPYRLLLGGYATVSGIRIMLDRPSKRKQGRRVLLCRSARVRARMHARMVCRVFARVFSRVLLAWLPCGRPCGVPFEEGLLSPSITEPAAVPPCHFSVWASKNCKN
ncbi:hypothetical protein PILCRDRAFT_735686 [Piloderma croceum F 1598]|uniref:Uncharacterized protein n=1 Tax=Piloderma croceum (strain F 1598) TaxID=765440 RepID=A0A0C3AGE7_PILCF|nr:hypothetical protein PILCRDRAFT_735686 [Piloderma croceum F 1598]